MRTIRKEGNGCLAEKLGVNVVTKTHTFTWNVTEQVHMSSCASVATTFSARAVTEGYYNVQIC